MSNGLPCSRAWRVEQRLSQFIPGSGHAWAGDGARRQRCRHARVGERVVIWLRCVACVTCLEGCAALGSHLMRLYLCIGCTSRLVPWLHPLVCT